MAQHQSQAHATHPPMSWLTQTLAVPMKGQVTTILLTDTQHDALAADDEDALAEAMKRHTGSINDPRTVDYNKPLPEHRGIRSPPRRGPILAYAIYWRAFRCMRWLLDHGANANAGLDHPIHPCTLLEWCAKQPDDYEAACILVNAGAHVEIRFGPWLIDVEYDLIAPRVFNLLFQRGLQVNLDDPGWLARDIREHACIIRTRENACRRACVALLGLLRRSTAVRQWVGRDVLRLVIWKVWQTRRRPCWPTPGQTIPCGFE